ncbi:MAG: hypothetical protein LBS45_07660 [Synergistaceae bacterium]|jgi:hypothetical protein|nr:hypothetical protein [Synergistaceae bacterium]
MSDKKVTPGRYNSLVSLIQAALTKTARAISSAMYVDYDKVSENNASHIKRETGVDVSGYTRTLTAEAVQHALDLHSEGGIRLEQYPIQLPLTPEDFELLPRLLNEPDSIALSNIKGPNGQSRIISRKVVNDAYVIVEEARPKKGLKKLTLVTMWKEKSGTPQSTPKALSTPSRAGNVPELGNNISQKGDNLNMGKAALSLRNTLITGLKCKKVVVAYVS